MGKCLGGVLSLFLILLLISPSSAISIRLDDPLTEVYYDVIDQNGNVIAVNYNSTQILTLENDTHYTVMLHSEPLRITSDPRSLYENLVNYGYVFIFVAVLIFLSGSLVGGFFGHIVRRRA